MALLLPITMRKSMFWRHFPGLAVAAVAAVNTGSALALSEAQVSQKLDTILMLMAVDDKGAPNALKANIDGKVVDAYIAAMSIAAAEEITAGKRYSLEPAQAKSLRFAPVSLARFNVLLEPLLKANSVRVGVIAPDPAQQKVAQELLIAQKVPAEQAAQAAALQPMVFCPEPGLLVSSNEGPEKGKQFVPCATEAEFVQGIVQRAIKESAKIAATKPHVVAIPLNSFISYLRAEPEAKAGALLVVPSGRMVSLIQQISQQQQSNAAATPTPATKPAPATKPTAP